VTEGAPRVTQLGERLLRYADMNGVVIVLVLVVMAALATYYPTGD
jgi:hypothetical protein